MRTLILAAALAALPFSALADDHGSKAKSWGLKGEEMSRFSAKVVEIKCELTGECADACGAGAYQLGLLTTEGKLIPVNKNGQTSFNGGVDDLLPYCGQTIEVDGLLVGDVAGNDKLDSKLYQVQLIKPEGGEWKKANEHTKAWKKKFPDAGGKGPWFRRDPRVLAQTDANGYMGLGLEEDKKFIKEWYSQ